MESSTLPASPPLHQPRAVLLEAVLPMRKQLDRHQGRVMRPMLEQPPVAFCQRLQPLGTIPLPPYITEYGGPAERYQTVYGRDPRSAAAPTAGLHFTDELLRQLQGSGVERRAVTLDVGPGTFVPVAADDPRDHVMHSEHVTLTEAAAAAIRQTRAADGQIVAVGTTVVRTLEHVAAESNDVLAYDGWTALKILPGYDFRVIDAMITNFHLPRSTLLMLVSAFAGLELTREAYRQAVEHRYRFYSFGDAMLLLP